MKIMNMLLKQGGKIICSDFHPFTKINDSLNYQFPTMSYFSTDVYERWEHDVEKAKKEGKKPLSLEEYLLETSKREIRHPATDMSLGWNALGITPPFLHGESGETDSKADAHVTGHMPNEDDWQTVDDLPVQETKQKRRELTDDLESISSYAESSILVPPRKGGGN